MQTHLQGPIAPTNAMPTSPRRRLLQALGVGAVTLGGAALTGAGIRFELSDRSSGMASIWNSEGHPILHAHEWLNTPALGPADLNGKVVLVNFWTYSCINSLRTLPYLRAWAAKYYDAGLVVLGVHSPEFAFEREIGNVQDAIASLGIHYPVVLDSDFAIWRSFGNRAWPGFYFVGADGRVRHQKFGEGAYDESETLIQRLLSEATGAAVTDEVEEIHGEGDQAAPDWPNLRSPETYVGYGNATSFVSPGGLRRNVVFGYQAPRSLPLNSWALSGSWAAGREYATLSEPGGRVGFCFHGRDLHLVLGRQEGGSIVRYRTTIDGGAPGVHHGVDADADGFGTVDEPRMYQLVRQQQPVADRTFGIEFLDAGARAYVFTFG